MTGENDMDGVPDPQPGGRKPAPGKLALVQAFMNTRWDLTTDGNPEILASPEALRDWLSARGLVTAPRRLMSQDLDRALAVREGLRALAFVNNDHDPGGPVVTAGWQHVIIHLGRPADRSAGLGGALSACVARGAPASRELRQ